MPRRVETVSPTQNPEDFLPLRPVEFDVLLVLANGDSHGYAIMKEAEERYEGARRIETGTLYRALRRLVSAGLIEPSDRRPAPEVDDERRRYFTITPLGRIVAAAEARRLRAQVEAAQARALLPEGDGRGGSA
jgi:DNA-binding PadR family transcriptional regulator